MLAEPSSPTFEAAAMPPTSDAALGQVARWEQRLRTNEAAFTPGDGGEMDLYWRQVVALFEVHRQITYGEGRAIAAETLAMLRPGHRWLVEQRWPSLVPSSADR
ncbi:MULTISPECIES: hypothetical protein [unclassified Pseudofrankia]|uniref:hypothetical protein n=1 Tax=unclassified Pseudofrankia TaxID=2994372 RepID=UPI0018E34138|nr:MULTISPECIES: hypothetical protein [unclassified Pseudofrankia]MDT3442928.1 hypothetical protein [Pseudofrankia sp. BMG5.37]